MKQGYIACTFRLLGAVFHRDPCSCSQPLVSKTTWTQADLPSPEHLVKCWQSSAIIYCKTIVSEKCRFLMPQHNKCFNFTILCAIVLDGHFYRTDTDHSADATISSHFSHSQPQCISIPHVSETLQPNILC